MTDALAFPLLPRRRVAGLAFGAMRSRSRGFGTDLAGARPYRPGDDVRRIDWRASARLSSASGSDEFVLRENLAEEATRVVVVVDRSPTMALYPAGFPWLCKPAAIAEAGSMILESALQSGCAVGYLDEGPPPDGRNGEPGNGARWSPPGSRTEPWRIRDEYLRQDEFDARPDSLAASLAYLAREERGLSPGTFVFLLSDFLTVPEDEAWQEAIDRGLDLVPVVIQDPVWEQSFPEVAGTVLPIADPATGRLAYVRLTRAEVQARGELNRARLRDILGRFELLGLDYALVSSHDRGHVLGSFLDWAAVRHQGARLA